ncbi:GGDEF domain-containing protein [Novosphingobium beihaiensis]|uniref:diguanylate cyclase n=1 Tax=Novosphingobium beihaiensis TaxID=2930389 RepID=A0ABT0BNC3_9SPHN|nr:GGDEF domain-containing protein [Novosphingobium beihaiensis]MCJ2186547.1 GGDEF domain-containing protein [Novosphingobium beihaiensis]
MRFYKATAFLFPNHYENRIILICSGAALIPLAACVAVQAASGQWDFTLLAIVLAATVTGTILAAAAIRALLAPLADAAALLQAVQAGETAGEIPEGGNDLVGRLLRGVATAANESAARIKRLTDAAERDPLTGIGNRRGFTDSAREVLLGQHTAVLALIAVDHFALIQEQFGEAAADKVLKAIGRRLESQLRRTDLTARWEGEKFAVLLPDTLLDEARLIMERLRASMALDQSLGEQGWPVTFSCGLAPIRNYAQFDEACSRAGAALGDASNGGRNRIHAAAN